MSLVKVLTTEDLENPPTEDEDEKAPTSENVFDHYADLDAHTYDLWQVMRTGVYYNTNLSTTHTTTNKGAITASKFYAMPFLVSRAITVDRIGIYIVGAGAGGTKLRLGIYNNGTNLYPGTLVVDGGEVAADAIAVVTVTIDEALTKGLYWVVFVGDSACEIRYTITALNILGSTTPSRFSLGWIADLAYTAGVTTLPDPYTAGGIVCNNYNYEVGLRIASLD